MDNVLILGDSYSTFRGFVPEGYAVYYSEKQRPETDVTKVEQTWWHQVMEKAGLNLVHNNSWSGSTIGYTGYEGKDCSQSSSFIYRLRQLIAEGFFEKNEINKVFLFGGTNDSWSDAPLGEETFSDWQEQALFCVLPAVGYICKLLKDTLPQAEIYCLLNTEIKEEIIACMEKACEKFGLIPVHFACIDKRSGHPTIQGMQDICEAVCKALKC